MNSNKLQRLKTILKEQSPKIVLITLILIFAFYSVFLALNLQEAIIPDEPAHITFSKHFAQTIGIPEDVPQTINTGWYIQQNPFLNHWLNGRAINLLELMVPSATDRQILIFLRLISVAYSIGTVFFCYLISKEIIKDVWWRLLPVFLLTNTLMFVFISGGVSYDNLANLLSMAALYFVVRVFNGKDFITNSLAWMILIFLGTLVKFTILPLALFMGILWLIFLLVRRKQIIFVKPGKFTQRLLFPILLVIIFANLGIYGVNLLKYQSVTPVCSDMFTAEQCALSPYVKRYNELALDHKLSIIESIELGYPNPLEYVIDSWIPHMLYRIFGILAHKSYSPSHIIILYRFFLLWIVLLAFRYVSKPSFTIISLFCIFLLYALVLLYLNYNLELAYGFKQIALQGRYLFPVIGSIYVLISYVMTKINNNVVRLATLIFTVILFFMGGPIKFILNYDTIFFGWFI
ncbi:MAG: hypothetical protein ACYC3H_07015 [Bellilinea sp.]